jgi:hypothetical protein
MDAANKIAKNTDSMPDLRKTLIRLAGEPPEESLFYSAKMF